MCEPNYFGSLNPDSCDTLCDGVVANDPDDNGKFCKSLTNFGIGGIATTDDAEEQEVFAMMRLAVSLYVFTFFCN